MASVAAAFDTTKNYSTGDLTLYEGKLYIFIQSHSAGAWNTNHVREYDNNLPSGAARVLSGKISAQEAIAFASKIAFEPKTISETRDRYILTNK